MPPLTIQTYENWRHERLYIKNKKKRSRKSPKPAKKSVTLALQGGGAHGAFTWGALDRLPANHPAVIEVAEIARHQSDQPAGAIEFCELGERGALAGFAVARKPGAGQGGQGDDDGDSDLCWQCGGEGVVYDCFEEYACVDPEGGCDLCERRCDVCMPHRVTLAHLHLREGEG